MSQPNETITMTATGTYAIADYIPPRCRKPRYTSFDTEVEVEIPVVGRGDVTLAFTSEETMRVGTEVVEYEGLLYTPIVDGIASGEQDREVHLSADSPRFSRVVDFRHDFNASSAEEFERQARERLLETLIVDGTVYTRVGEPRYVVSTFGFGNNHGGTSLTSATFDNGNIPAEMYFRADEFEQARSRAIEVALKRGDTNDVPRLEQMKPIITVHNPDSVKLVTFSPVPEEVDDARFEYSMAVGELHRATTVAEEAEAADKVFRLRNFIINNGYTPVQGDERPYEDR